MTMRDDTPNIFGDDWRECLAAHYMHVIRTDDQVTRPSLTEILHDAGFSESELIELQVRATIRAEDMPDGFVPDLDALASHQAEAAIHPAVLAPEEALEAEADPIPSTYDELSEALHNDDAEEPVTESQPEPPEPEDDAEQLSLF